MILKLLPVEVRVGVLGFLKRMGNGTMGNTHLVCKQACNKVSVTVVSDDQVRIGLELSSNFVRVIISECFQVRPDLKT